MKPQYTRWWLACLLLTSSMLAFAANQETQASTKPSIEPKAMQLLATINASKSIRSKLPSFVQQASSAIEKHNGALPAEYTLQIGKTLTEANNYRKPLFDEALRQRSLLYRTDKALDARERIDGLIMGMSAAVTLFDNNREMQKAFADHSLLRKKLNEGYPEFGIEKDFYNNSMQKAASPEYRKAMQDAIAYFGDNKTAIEQHLQTSGDAMRALYQNIAESPTLKGLQGSNIFKEIVLLPITTTQEGFSLTRKCLNKLKFTTSKVVGNSMGFVRWRGGKLKGDKAMLETMLAHLEPGDILLEKTAGTLTDKSIPGHFGHVAIFTGTHAQLQALGAFDKADSARLKQYEAKIKQNHTVVEALRNGVQLDTLQDFMNVDDLAILRPKYLIAADKLEAVNLALGNIGKKYDFNFDVNTTETIVCSELAYLVYPQIDFVTKRVLNSFTISPDDVAQQAGAREQDPLSVVLFAHDGKLVLDNTHQPEGQALYDQLVKGIAPNTPNAPENESAQAAFFKGFIH